MLKKKQEEGRAWKPRRIKFYPGQGAFVFDYIIDVFTSKLAPGCIGFIDQQGRMFVTNLPFIVFYERVQKNDIKKGGEKK